MRLPVLHKLKAIGKNISEHFFLSANVYINGYVIENNQVQYDFYLGKGTSSMD